MIKMHQYQSYCYLHYIALTESTVSALINNICFPLSKLKNDLTDIESVKNRKAAADIWHLPFFTSPLLVINNVQCISKSLVSTYGSVHTNTYEIE